MALQAAPSCPDCGAPVGSDGICDVCVSRETHLVDQGVTHPASAGAIDVPASIGPYKILRVLGEGGMGVVYLAEQAEPFRRAVAVKVIKIGMDTREVVARFEAERQALALMSHSHIAQIYEAGATPDGRPYFVMEYVDGVPITDYCDRHQLSTRARLELFVLVCGAFEHAHQKGIIHRDVKPQNVLVTMQDGRPVPKVIDFGVAKATRQRLTEKTIFTHLGLLIGTPAYMSPEQAELGGVEITAATDVYSLGVLLYELLVSALPFDPSILRRAGYAEIQRIIREEEPVSPSTRLSALGASATPVAQQRDTNVTTLVKEIKGDLDWIALKALEKAPDKRYPSASELAADVSRYLQNERVLARPSSLRSRLRRLGRLHARPVAAVSVLVLVLVAGVWLWASASGVTLRVTKPVGGTVIGAGLVCGTHGTTCAAKRTAGDIIELQILTDPGYVFDGFDGDCAPAGRILMNTAKTCVANFTQVGPAATPVTRAEGLFYEMKAQDVIIARIQEDLVRTGSTVSPENLKALQDRRRQLEQFYDEVVSSSYARRLNERERLILRVTRLLGESDAAAPREYVSEVNRYIERWRTTPRWAQGVKRAQENGYTKTIAETFIAQHLPPQFFYLALQESSFIPTAVGPPTRSGIAKGMWQIIPEIGSRYGLRTGPLSREPQVDPQDERMDWQKSTYAAARYIKDMYATEAQASGLLVMASYNWGDRHVLDRLTKMPQNPRERNFWTLLAQYPGDVPPEVYNYVFSIVSAAVIGENPRLFGLEFDNPLAFAASR